MSILPSNGVPPSETQNGLVSPNLAEGCENKYYPPRCNPRLDPFAQNALISEILNAINLLQPYDCNRTDNLAQAIQLLRRFSGIPFLDPDGNDFLAGMFDDAPGLAPMASVLGLAPMVYPTATEAVANEDFVGFYNTTANRTEKVTITEFKKVAGAAPYAGTDPNNKEFPIGTTLMVDLVSLGSYGGINRNSQYEVFMYPFEVYPMGYSIANWGTGTDLLLNGTWSARGCIGFSSGTDNDNFAHMQRVA